MGVKDLVLSVIFNAGIENGEKKCHSTCEILIWNV